MNKILFISFIFMILSCENDSRQGIFTKDIYSGTFLARYGNDDGVWEDFIIFEIEDDQFEYYGSNDLIYGLGHYIEYPDTVHFIDEVPRPELYTWEWMLHGKFRKESKGDTLVFTRESYQNTFRYTLW